MQRCTVKYCILFSAVTTLTGNPDQATYTAANTLLDENALCTRPTFPNITSTAFMWGPVGEIGMRLNSFASEDEVAS